MRVLSHHLRLALSCSCFDSVFPHNTKTLLCTENCALLGYCAAISGHFLPTFRDNWKVPSSGWTLRLGPFGCPEISVRNDHHSLRNNPEERSSQLLRGRSLKSRIVMHFSCVPRLLHDHPPNVILLYFFTQLIFVQLVQWQDCGVGWSELRIAEQAREFHLQNAPPPRPSRLMDSGYHLPAVKRPPCEGDKLPHLGRG